MKKLACFVVEIEEWEDAQDVVRKIENALENKSVAYNPQNNMSYVSNWKLRFESVMNQLGVDNTYKGYMMLYYIMEAIAQNPSDKDCISLKVLYAHITKKTRDTYVAIERRIRTLVEAIYERTPTDYVNEILNIPGLYNDKVANKKFIAALVKVVFG